MPRLRETCDMVRRGKHLNQKRLAQPGRLLSIPVDSLIKFDLGNFEKPDGDGRYLATTSLRSLAAISPRR
jgi:hypothetical protein